MHGSSSQCPDWWHPVSALGLDPRRAVTHGRWALGLAAPSSFPWGPCGQGGRANAGRLRALLLVSFCLFSWPPFPHHHTARQCWDRATCPCDSAGMEAVWLGGGTVPSPRVPWWQSSPPCSPEHLVTLLSYFPGLSQQGYLPPPDKVMSCWSRAAPNPIGLCPYRRGLGHRDMHREKPRIEEALQAKDARAPGAGVGRPWLSSYGLGALSL